MKPDEILDLENRKIIYDYINKCPGIHLSGLFRKFDKMSRGTIRYHLKYLYRRGLINAKKEDGYNRYYPKDEIPAKFKGLLGVIRRRTPRNIILILLTYTICTRKDIANELGKHPTTIYTYIQELVDKGIIEEAPSENGIVHTSWRTVPHVKYEKVRTEIVYRLNDPHLIYDMIIVLRDKLTSDVNVSSILEFMEFVSTIKNRRPKIITGTIDSGFDNVVNTFYEMFPLSFMV
jgi:DNA-binding transcriptional ArsR family regulator